MRRIARSQPVALAITQEVVQRLLRVGRDGNRVPLRPENDRCQGYADIYLLVNLQEDSEQVGGNASYREPTMKSYFQYKEERDANL